MLSSNFKFYSLFLAVLLISFPQISLADEGSSSSQIQDVDEFVNMVNTAFPGMVQPIGTSPAAGTHSGGDPTLSGPIQDMNWNQYMDGLDALDAQLEKGEITEDDWFEKTHDLQKQFSKSEKRRNRNMRRRPHRPVDALSVQKTVGVIPPKNPASSEEEP